MLRMMQMIDKVRPDYKIWAATRQADILFDVFDINVLFLAVGF